MIEPTTDIRVTETNITAGIPVWKRRKNKDITVKDNFVYQLMGLLKCVW